MGVDSTDRLNEIFATSLYNYKSTLADNIFESFPLFDALKKKGNIVMEDNANDIVEPLLYGLNSTVKSYSGYDIIDTTPPEGIGSAKYPMKQVAGSVTIDRFSERQNAGKGQIIKLFKAKMDQLQLSFEDAINAMLFSDGSGNDSKDLLGLQKLVSTNDTDTVGGLSSESYSWWRCYNDNGANGANAYDSLISDMKTMYNSISHKLKHPNLGITAQTIYEAYEGLLVADINYNVGQASLAVGGVGFENLKYKGLMLTYDLDCTAGYMYFLNTDNLKLHCDSQTYFVSTPFIQPYNQDARTAMVLLYAELTTNNRRMQGVLSGIT